jgi:hypothetical protein
VILSYETKESWQGLKRFDSSKVKQGHMGSARSCVNNVMDGRWALGFTRVGKRDHKYHVPYQAWNPLNTNIELKKKHSSFFGQSLFSLLFTIISLFCL